MKKLLLSTILILIFVCAKKDKTQIRYVRLPKELIQKYKGDTLMIGSSYDTLTMEFYNKKNGVVTNNWLYIIK